MMSFIFSFLVWFGVTVWFKTQGPFEAFFEWPMSIEDSDRSEIEKFTLSGLIALAITAVAIACLTVASPEFRAGWFNW